jgi:hypothetical protein
VSKEDIEAEKARLAAIDITFPPHTLKNPQKIFL